MHRPLHDRRPSVVHTILYVAPFKVLNIRKETAAADQGVIDVIRERIVHTGINLTFHHSERDAMQVCFPTNVQRQDSLGKVWDKMLSMLLQFNRDDPL